MIAGIGTSETERRKICTQPGCFLRRKGINGTDVADLLVRMLGGGSADILLSDSERIEVRPDCAECALSVMNGGRAFFTRAEWNHLDELGEWHQRCFRRNRRLFQ